MSDSILTEKENIPPIKTIKEAIRLRPGMYIGWMNHHGWMNNLKSILIYFLKNETVLQNKVSLTLIAKDQARLSIQSQEKCAVESWNPDKSIDFTKTDLYKEELDLLVLNALCLNFVVTYYKDSIIQYQCKYEQGIFGGGDLESNQGLNYDRIELSFQLDPNIWGEDFVWNPQYIAKELNEFAYLCPSTRFYLNYEVDEEKCQLIYHFRNGLMDLFELEDLNSWQATYFKTRIKEEFGAYHIEAVFGFREHALEQDFSKSYVNYAETIEHGTHVDALLKGIVYAIMCYFQKHDLTDQYKISAKGIQKYLVSLIHIQLENPIFDGCVRNKLGNTEIVDPISKGITFLFLKEIEQHPAFIEKLIQKFKI